MRKLNKLAAAVAVALGMGAASQAHALMEASYSEEGDALIFPVFHGGLNNYFAISNNSNNWVQGHIRFRGAAWSGELLDFDMILSPGDVAIFRLTDLNGDGLWELDQSLDENNFAYTGMLDSCVGVATPCKSFSTILYPSLSANPNSNIEQADLDYNDQLGYIEFIPEAVLVGMTEEIMADLLDDDDTDEADAWRTDVGTNRGTNAWAWSRLGGNTATAPTDYTRLAGVGNWLSGTFYTAIPGVSAGMAGNAMVFKNFRTSLNPHRVDDYFDVATLTGDNEVIMHHEASSVDGSFEYVYRFDASEDRFDERRISFNNTWGPTLLDGDDYYLGDDAMAIKFTASDTFAAGGTVIGLSGDMFYPLTPVSVDPINRDMDYWDSRLGVPNSYSEVEVELHSGGQSFTSHFFDMDSNEASTDPLMSFYFAHFPTKYMWGESATFYGATTLQGYIQNAVNALLGDNFRKAYRVEVWDTDEHFACQPESHTGSPYVPQDTLEACLISMPYELRLFSIADLKATQPPGAMAYNEGKVALMPLSGHNDPRSSDPAILNHSFPGTMYHFNVSLGNSIDLQQWRAMFASRRQ